MTRNKMCVHSYRCNLHANLPQWDKLEKQLQFANDSIAWRRAAVQKLQVKVWFPGCSRFLSINVSDEQCF